MATSALVGDLLGALSKSSGHSVDGLSAKQLLDSLPQTAAPLTRRGADLDAVFSQRVSTGGLEPLANHVHVPIQGSGFCFLTALAASRDMTTPQLVGQLKTAAGGDAALTATLVRMLGEASGNGIDAGKQDVKTLLARAGIEFSIFDFNDDGSLLSSPFDVKPDAVNLMLRKGHFDLLMPASGFDAATLSSLPNNCVLQGTIPSNAEIFAAASNA